MRKDIGALVENNMDLVHKVIRDCVYMPKEQLKNEYDDLFQIGSIALWNAAKAYDPESAYAFSTLAYTCIKNAIINELSKAYRRREVLPEEGFWETINSANSPLDITEQKDLLKYITEGIRTLDERRGLEIIAQKLSGFSYDEIEKRAGMSKNTLYRCVHAAQKAMKKRRLEYVS